MRKHWQVVWWCAGYCLLLAGCHPSRHLIRSWHAQEPAQHQRAPVALRFDAHNTTHWQLASDDTLRFRYDIEADTLWIMDRYMRTPFHIGQLSRKKLLLLRKTPNGTDSLCFLAGARLAKTLQLPPPNLKEKSPASQQQGREHTIESMLPALYSPTVELRLKNMLLLFEEGDYISTPTIERLIGLPSFGSVPETNELAMQRHIVHRILRITRKGNAFEATLRKNAPIDASLPIYGWENGKRVLRNTLDLHVSPQAKASFSLSYHDIAINIEGVKLGKGWLQVGIPPLRISGDWGALLGIRFYLAR